MAELVPAAIVAPLIAPAEQAASAWKVPDGELDARVTVRPGADTLDGLPEASCDWTITAAEHAPATTVRGGLPKPSRTGAPALKVCSWVALVSPVPLTVRMAVPAAVSLK